MALPSRHLLAALFAAAVAAASLPARGEADAPALAQSILQNSIERALTDVRGSVDLRREGNTEALRAFYEARKFRPAWLENANPTAQASVLISVLSDAGRHGLDPSAYRIDYLSELRESRTLTDLVRLEVALSRNLLRYLVDLQRGHLVTDEVDPALMRAADKAERPALLTAAVQAIDLRRHLAKQAPRFVEYERLKGALADYRETARAGGWPKIADGPLLREGDRSSRVDALRRRLTLSGDLPGQSVAEPSLFSAEVADGLRRFQERQGLRADGILGPRTLEALNVPVERRIDQIIIAMERWRWMPREPGERYVRVNLAGFQLDVVEHGQVVMNMPVVIGREDLQTPVFSDRMTYLEFSPTWTIPPSIVRNELLPKIRRDVGYLAEHDMTVYSGWSEDAIVVDPESIDWHALNPRQIPFKIVQAAGPKNPLGQVKFMFPNKYAIYLHDTPSPHLFEQPVRTFSHGCIRVARPFELALYLLGDQPGVTTEQISAYMALDSPKRVDLSEPVPVYITYVTAWADGEGTVHFRRDIYGRDRGLLETLQSRDVDGSA